MRGRFVSTGCCILGLLALAAPAAADLRVDGRGWGHGVGLSQYGTYGYALLDRRGHAWILRHFYTGTGLARTAAGSVRVRLDRAATATMSGVTRLVGAGGRSVALSDGHRYGVSFSGATDLLVRDLTTKRVRARATAPATFSGGTSWCLRGTAENGVHDGCYRGSARLARDGDQILVVDRVGLEGYLRGVVPAEMPSWWPAEALRTQAVVARSYALRNRRPEAPFDLFADTRSQVYRGIAGETRNATAAVEATAAEVVTAGGEVAQTYYFSSSGGRTAGNEEVWAGAPVPYLRSVDDPHDDLSPYHEWSVTFTDDELARRLADVSPGTYRSMRVATRTASGRAGVVEITGDAGMADVPATKIRELLGLRSTWFSLAAPAGIMPSGRAGR